MKLTALRSAVLLAGILRAGSAGAEEEPSPSASSRVAPEKDRLGWAVPDYARLQTGGFLGMFTVAVGYAAFSDRLNVAASYGFVPRMNGVAPTHLVSALLFIRPLRFSFGDRDRWEMLPLYVGVGAMGAFGPNVFVRQPPQYPKGYYAPTAIHAAALLGVELGRRADEGQLFVRESLFAEVVTIDQYLDALKDNGNASLLNAFSSEIGVRASF